MPYLDGKDVSLASGVSLRESKGGAVVGLESQLRAVFLLRSHDHGGPRRADRGWATIWRVATRDGLTKISRRDASQPSHHVGELHIIKQLALSPCLQQGLLSTTPPSSLAYSGDPTYSDHTQQTNAQFPRKPYAFPSSKLGG